MLAYLNKQAQIGACFYLTFGEIKAIPFKHLWCLSCLFISPLFACFALARDKSKTLSFLSVLAYIHKQA
jgi:hypothetical protein